MGTIKKKNQHRMKVVRTGEEHTPESMSTAEMFRMMKAGTVFRTIEDLPDSECRKFLDMRAQSNLDVKGHPFRHMAADGTVVKLQKPSSFV